MSEYMQETKPIKQIAIIALSFLIGMILQIVPLPQWAIWARPEWVFIILLFWVMAQPQYVGVCVAFFVGILMDLLSGTLLGQHAFVFTLMTYLVLTFHARLTLFPLWQQSGIVFMLVLSELALQCWILEVIGMVPQNWSYWLPALSSTLIWPWFSFLLKERYETIRGFG